MLSQRITKCVLAIERSWPSSEVEAQFEELDKALIPGLRATT